MSNYSHSLSDYDYHLPKENIAQHPVSQRDHSKLLILQKHTRQLLHRQFSDILDLLRPDDIIVVNNTKVFPARMLGHKSTGGKVELFLLQFPTPLPSHRTGYSQAQSIALLKSSKRPKEGTEIFFSDNAKAVITGYQADGKAEITLYFTSKNGQTLENLLDRYGQVPLPPYIERPHGTTSTDKIRYQTGYAQHTGSVAAPTAGLHFSDDLLTKIEKKGVAREAVTLHVGYGTFAPVRNEDIRKHSIHSEQVTITPETANRINAVKKSGGRIWAVGTTTVRSLEFSARKSGEVTPISGACDLFIYPGYRFRIVDNLITNFHLPKSSLLFLVSALVEREVILYAYKEAIKNGYRFFSYGDAMAIITRP